MLTSWVCFVGFPKTNIWEVHGRTEFTDKHGNQLTIIRYCVPAISKLLASTSADYGNDQPDAWRNIHYSNLGFLAPILGAIAPQCPPPWLYAYGYHSNDRPSSATVCCCDESMTACSTHRYRPTFIIIWSKWGRNRLVWGGGQKVDSRTQVAVNNVYCVPASPPIRYSH